jgi:tetratricopeptide (TPR) repeat protein
MDQALEAFRRAYAIYERIGYRQGQFEAMGGLGNAYKFEHDSARAGNSWMRCLVIAREMGSPFREAIARGQVGTQDEASGKHYDALENYGQAAQLASRIGAYGLEANNLESLGEIHAEMGGQEPAAVYFDRAMEAAKKSGDSYLQISTAMDIARAYSRLRDAERTREALSRLRDLCSAAGYANQAAEAQRRIDELPH